MQFPAEDDAGTTGILTRTGTPNADGTTLTVTVPSLAKSGLVPRGGQRGVVPAAGGADTALVGGLLAAGSTLVVEGTGLKGHLSVTIDGIAASPSAVQTSFDAGFPQQVVTVTAPAGVVRA